MIQKIVFFCSLCLALAPSSLSAEAKGNKVIKVGATLALTGKYAFVGEAERDGMLLAVEEVNREGGLDGRMLELVIEDNAGEPKAAISSVQKLFEADQIDVLFSAFTHITQAIKSIAARHKKVMFYASSMKTIAQESPYFFRDYFDSEASGVALAKLAKSHGHSKVVFITEQGEACVGYSEAFKKEAEVLGIKILSIEEFISGERDLRPMLLRSSQKKPEALVFCAWRDAHTLMRQIEELGLIKIATYHSFAPFLPVADTVEMRSLYEKNKAFTTWFAYAEKNTRLDADNKNEQQKFREAFREKFGHEPRPDAAYVYDDIKLLAKAIRPCLSDSRVNQECLSAELLKTSHFGPSGKLTFDEFGNSNREVLIMTVKSGAWTLH